MTHHAPALLVVDDEVDTCRNLSDILTDLGYRVDVAHDQSAAADQLRDTAFRVVLIDMKLPHGNGAEVYRLVREANPQARTVVVTGFRGEMEQRVEQVLRQGADAVCYKPFDVGHLLTTLERLTH